MSTALRRGLVALGTLALVAAAGLAALAVPAWQADTVAAQARLRDALRQRTLAEARQRATEAPDAPAPLAAALPPDGAAGERLGALLAQAGAAGLQVASTRQARARPLAGGLLALPVTVQASGRYADLRLHLAGALQADPALVLDALRLQRADARADRLEIELRWTLLAAAPAPAQTAATGAAR